MKVKEFSEKYWALFSGCMRWYGKDNEGYEPLIGAGIFGNGKRYGLVLDPTGAIVLIESDNQNGFDSYVLRLEFPTQAAALVFAEGIGEPKSMQDFLRLGFRKI